MMKQIETMQVRLTGDKIQQTDRNRMRAAIVAETMAMFKAAGLDCAMTKDGLAVCIPHEDLGCVCFIADIKMKDLNYDYDFEVDDYAATLAAKEAEAKAKAEAKARKVAEDKARREAKAQAEAAKNASI